MLPAHALELGAANLRSALGERLLVEIPLASELPLPAGCIDARVGNAGGVLRSMGQRQLPGGLVLSTRRIVAEPVLALSVSVACPGLPRLTRDYTLFLDPAARGSDAKPSVLVARRGTPAPRSRPAPVAKREPATTATSYRVRSGDTVSALAAALTAPGRDYWPMVERIVSSNPEAFVDGDPDRLLAGSLLSLPAGRAPSNVASASRTVGAGAEAAPTTVAVPGNAAPAATIERARIVAPAPARADAEIDAVAAARSTADRLLNVLNGPDVPTDAVAVARPFADAPQAAGEAELGAAADATPTAAADAPWTGRLAGLAVGMFVALATLAAWRRVTRPGRGRRERRAIETPRAPMPESLRAELRRQPVDTTETLPAPEADPHVALPPLTTDGNGPRDDLAPRETSAFTFHTPRPAESIPAPKRREPGIRVDELESFDFADLQRGLDDATQEMLAADYEAEFTRTQLLEQEAATRALRAAEAPEHDVTIEMQGYETGSDTVRMPADYDAGFAEATEARYVDESTANVETEAMPGLDLDLDLPGTSSLLRASGEALSEALGEDLDIDADEAPRKKQA